MIPTTEGYKVLIYKVTNEKPVYKVYSIYDLFHINDWYPVGPEFDNAKDAFAHAGLIFESDLREYERCKDRGCSFPYND